MTKEEIKKWKKKPNIDPYDGSEIKTSIVLGSKYTELYEKFITELTKDLTPVDIINPEIFEDIRKQLPTNHIYVLNDIDYIENLKQKYNDTEEDKWIDFLVKQKKLLYGKEQILDKKGYTVYDHLFMQFYFIKYKQHFNEITKYIHNQEFLYETIENQIKLVKAVDMDCYEVIDSMLKFTSEENKGINFQVKKKTLVQNKCPYYIPPLLNLFIQYVYEISHYLIPIQALNPKIFHDYFLYGYKIPKLELGIEKKIEVIDYSIKYNKNRLKTILNLILGSMYNSNNSEKINVNTFLKILWTEIKDVILTEQKFIYDKAGSYSQDKQANYIINKQICDSEIKNIKLFFVSSLFDIETVHKESQQHNNVLYEPVIDPYNNLPEPPKMPRRPVISQDLQRYKMTSDIKGKNSAKEKELKEYLEKEKQFEKELKSYDKKLKDYNDKHLDKKLSPFFSVKLSRARSVINDKNPLRLSYLPLKVSAKSLTKFKSKKQKELLSKFEKEPYNRTYKQNEIDKEKQRIEKIREAKRQGEIEKQRIEIERQRIETERERLVEQGRAQQEREREIQEEVQQESERERQESFHEVRRQREIERQRLETERQEIESEREHLVAQGRAESERLQMELQREREQMFQVWQERERDRQEREREIEREVREEIERQRLETERARQEREQDREWLRARSDSISSHYSESPHSDIRSRSGRSTSTGSSSGYSYSSGGGSKEPLTESDLKLKLALEARKFKQFAKPSPSGKSPRQKYIGCDLNDNDPITQETLGDLHFKKIKYLSKIKTTLPDGKIVTHCYDTIPFYNYILDCNNKGDTPLNLAIGKELLTQKQKAEVFKKIKLFTTQPTLELNIDTKKKYFLKVNYKPSQHSEDHYTTYDLYAQINIGSIDFNLFGNTVFTLHKAPIISRDDMLFEDTSDETVLLIQKGMENGSLLRVNSYPYWKPDIGTIRIRNNKILLLPPFTFSTRDSIQELEEKTKVFNNRLRILI